MGTGPYNEPLTSPVNFFPGRKRRVAKLFTNGLEVALQRRMLETRKHRPAGKLLRFV